MDHKEMTSHIRGRIKAAGITAKCSMYTSCGQPMVRVCVPTYDARFNRDEIHAIALIAKSNRLTNAQCSTIDPYHEEKLTGKIQWNFEFHAVKG